MSETSHDPIPIPNPLNKEDFRDKTFYLVLIKELSHNYEDRTYPVGADAGTKGLSKDSYLDIKPKMTSIPTIEDYAPFLNGVKIGYSFDDSYADPQVKIFKFYRFYPFFTQDRIPSQLLTKFGTGVWIQEIKLDVDNPHLQIYHNKAGDYVANMLELGIRYHIYDLNTIIRFDIKACDSISHKLTRAKGLTHSKILIRGACKNGYTPTLQYIYDKVFKEKCSGWIFDYDWSAMSHASKNNRVEVLQWWANHSAIIHYGFDPKPDVESSDPEKQLVYVQRFTSVDFAVKGGSIEALEWLYNAKINGEALPFRVGSHTIDYACQLNDPKVLQWLFDRTYKIVAEHRYDPPDMNDIDSCFNDEEFMGGGENEEDEEDEVNELDTKLDQKLNEKPNEKSDTESDAESDDETIKPDELYPDELYPVGFWFDRDYEIELENNTCPRSIRFSISKVISTSPLKKVKFTYSEQMIRSACREGCIKILQWFFDKFKEGILRILYDTHALSSVIYYDHLKVIQWWFIRSMPDLMLEHLDSNLISMEDLDGTCDYIYSKVKRSILGGKDNFIHWGNSHLKFLGTINIYMAAGSRSRIKIKDWMDTHGFNAKYESTYVKISED